MNLYSRNQQNLKKVILTKTTKKKRMMIVHYRNEIEKFLNRRINTEGIDEDGEEATYTIKDKNKLNKSPNLKQQPIAAGLISRKKEGYGLLKNLIVLFVLYICIITFVVKNLY